MRNSHNKKVTLSLGVAKVLLSATIFASFANAATTPDATSIQLDDSKLTHLGNGDYQFVISKPMGEIIYINNTLGENEVLDEKGSAIKTVLPMVPKNITINAKGDTVIINGGQLMNGDRTWAGIGGAESNYNFTINADTVKLIGTEYNDDDLNDNFGVQVLPDGSLWQPDYNNPYNSLLDTYHDNTFMNVFKTGVINGNLETTAASVAIVNGNLFGRNYNGNLTVNGNLISNDTKFTFFGNHQFNVSGTAIIRDSEFSLVNFSNPVTENGIYLLSSGKGLNKDITETNTVRNVLLIPDGKLLGLKGDKFAEYEGELTEIILDKDNKLFTNKLVVSGNTLYVKNSLTAEAKKMSIGEFLKETRTQILDQLIAHFTEQYNDSITGSGIQPRAATTVGATAQATQYKKIIEQLTQYKNDIEANKKVVSYGKNVDNILASLKNSNREVAASSALLNAIKGNVNQAKTIEASAKESADNSNRQGAIQVINLANEMAISNRMAQLSNSTTNDLNNGFWANGFGGGNFLGDNESVYGMSVGFDRKVGDDIIVGGYLTYADSTLTNNSISQDSDNLQLGLYSRIATGSHEFDIKGYTQFSFADQNRMINDSVQTSDFTQTFLGLSGAYGYVFNLNNGFAIKPLAGLNLYYSHTPDYTEEGLWAQHVNSMDSFAFSGDLGVEFRKFFDGGSYIYITPKIEQFFVVDGDVFRSGFTGSNLKYSIHGDESNKTYGQIILGSDISVSKNFSINVSAGIKQILGNKDSNTDETYVSGNLGATYKF
ncbi:autotransporter outer membrane beta-barrel domain-containing protein [Campylobacter jejuni]|nr:autotransporter outer membrane beta-barrel domain-containing protein [Campylobacter jejuni]EDP3961280.1 autotransporter outer membrane beta-barrel domain-containing protein [Campylobacter jejuni]OEW88894.1 hypothetical protein A0M29_07195 [Campylobacter jejuni]RTH84717.1 autotransporter domain-containing protein [Campylobacter jejuni]RTI99518.1 autotransporter domain-containing protein [Campylobacter jejuni]HEF2527834.1 autotransporter outer membrane beta-barrel domain-containing protein [C